MAQQAEFKKLKEQIEAAKRGLTKMSDAEIDDGPHNIPFTDSTHDFASPTSPKIVEAKQVKTNSGDVSSSESINTKVVDMMSKTVLTDTPTADNGSGNSGNELADDFQFFHRQKRQKSKDDFVLGALVEETNNVEADGLLIERLDRRLGTLENGVEQNRKYILELINLLSKLDSRQTSAKRKLKPSQRLNRRHIFWFVIGFLAVGWFGLTPSGHMAVRHFLTFI